jgi:diaminohydroxyphosphoribosylaminopyrimidine deaminase/5-amino-6-(5-phosphoribosylamino)uracil reductase
MTGIDTAHMKLALKLAAKGAGWVSPNPMVGAVLVQDGQIVGKGYHRRFGLPHAEVEALRRAGDAARGADLYVTLEPCNHHGRTPPCTRAILAAGVRRVIMATPDPNPKVAGHGAAFLSSHGVEVEAGVLGEEARRLNEAWFKWVETGMPFVVAKAACSLDGKIATATGESQWLTGEKARAFGHRLRHECDAILVGIDTVLTDDPQLTTRLVGGRKMVGGEGQGLFRKWPLPSYPKPPLPTPYGYGGTGVPPVQTENRKPKTENRPFKDPIRIVLDSNLRIPLNARLLHLDSPALTWVACTEAAPAAKIRALQKLGAEVLLLPAASEESGRVALQPLLELLGKRQVQSLLVEGGAQVLGAFFEQKLVNKFYFFYAPLFLGGQEAPGVLGGRGIDRLQDAERARDLTIRRVGKDILIIGYL